MGSKVGAMKVAAKRIGVTIEEYQQRIEQGLKWCHTCRRWVERDGFHIDKSRGDGLATVCKSCRASDDPYASLRGRVSTFKGMRHTDDAKQKMSLARKGKPSKRLGVPHTIETRKKISVVTRERTPRGEECHSYKDGKLSERRDQRFSMQYKRWRFDVFSRDNFTCQRCGDARGGNLHAHHLKPFADYPELRFDVSNGVTLCEACHKLEHGKA